MYSKWPRTKEDCKIGFNGGSIPTCDIAYDGGAENVNKLCVSLWDDSYDIYIKITEVDSSSANDVTGLKLPYNAIPTFTKKEITRFTMKKFIQENAMEEAFYHDGCISIDFDIAWGFGST